MSTRWHIYAGTFTDFFYAMTLDTETLEVTGMHKVPDPAGRSAFFALSTDRHCLYVANEYQAGAGGVASFRLDANGEPRFLNAQESRSQGPAHISLMRAS